MRAGDALQHHTRAPIRNEWAPRAHRHGDVNASPDGPANATAKAATNATYSLSERYGQRRQFELQIQTRDGDTVTIKVAAEQLQSLIARQSETEQGSEFAARYAEKNSLQFSFRVEGSLDEDELNALDELFANANKLADSFYAGDVETAFAQASAMQFNSEEIAHFSLKMSQQESYSKTETYKAVQGKTEDQGGQGVNSAHNPNDLFKKLGKFLFDANEFMKRYDADTGLRHQAKQLLDQLPAKEENKNPWQAFLTSALQETS